MLRYQLSEFYRSSGRIPDDLSVIHRRKGYADGKIDGWGRPIRYSRTTDGTLLLESEGRDGKPGGTGPDGDITVKFSLP